MTKVKLNLAGFRQLRFEEAYEKEIRRRAEAIREAAEAESGVEGYVLRRQRKRRNRAAYTITATGDAMRAEATGHHLVRNIDKGRS